MKNTHSLKCWPKYYKAVESGEKPFEVRKWDRLFKVGDDILLREWDPEILDYTGNQICRTISYVLDMTYLPGSNIPHFAGYAVLGLEQPNSKSLLAENKALRNELCLKCGKYKQAHNGACDCCKWNGLKGEN